MTLILSLQCLCTEFDFLIKSSDIINAEEHAMSVVFVLQKTSLVFMSALKYLEVEI